MILYLHGFQSGPASEKAQQTLAYLRQLGRDKELICPQLPPQPRAAMLLLRRLLKGVPAAELTLIGSSLGGYYSLYLAEALGCRAVLVNPAIRPYELLQQYLGWHEHPYTGERFEVCTEHIRELMELDAGPITSPQRYWLLAATGDQTLDSRQALTHLYGANQTIIAGDEHAFLAYARFLPAIMRFADGEGVLPVA